MASSSSGNLAQAASLPFGSAPVGYVNATAPSIPAMAALVLVVYESHDGQSIPDHTSHPQMVLRCGEVIRLLLAAA
jgi:hypothetical protein